MKSSTQDPNHTTLAGERLLDQYVLEHSDDEPDYLYQLWRATNVHMLHGRMASGRLQGRLLKMFVEMIRPQHILEVGTFSGYSALCMAEGLANVNNLTQKAQKAQKYKTHTGEDDSHNTENAETFSDFSDFCETKNRQARVWTFEINDEQEPFTRKWIEQSPWADYVTFIIGDAKEKAKELGVKFDMAFLDGDKKTYVETYEAILPLMNPGAFILADNTLWDGHVIDPDYDRDNQTQGIRRFNDHIKNDPRVSRVILPLRDGLTIIRKK